MNKSNKFFADRLLQIGTLSEEQENALQSVLFPSFEPDPNMALLESTRQMVSAYTEWEKKEADKQPKGIMTDAEIELTIYGSQKGYPEHLRLVRFFDDEQDREFMFLTNATELTALQVADLYKNRWQIELFFKWLKQHLKIKKFWGTTENAVRIQIYSAICAYCLVAILLHDMKLERSTYEVLQILSMSLTDTTHLRDLFDKTIFKNDKDRSGSGEPNLFNF